MENLTITRYHIPVKGVAKKTICHFSDVHLTAYDDLSTPKEREKAIQDTQSWIDTRRFFAEKYGCPTGEAQMADSRVQYARLLALGNTADAVVITGDIMNNVTPADIRATEVGLATLQVPFVAGRRGQFRPHHYPRSVGTGGGTFGRWKTHRHRPPRADAHRGQLRRRLRLRRVFPYERL